MIKKSTQMDEKNSRKYWQVEPHEGKKLYPLMAMMFLICFSYTLLRDLKDIMLLEISSSEAMSYLKVLATLPVSVIFMMVYTKATVQYSKQLVFYSNMIFFIVIFIITMILYAFRDKVESYGWSDPSATGIGALMIALENWTIILIFVFAEMYGSVVLSLLFWGYCNDICTTQEASRFYPLINLVANISLVVLGLVFLPLDAFLKNHKDMFLYTSYCIAIFCVICIMYLYHWMDKNVLTDPLLYRPEKIRMKGKKKMGFKDSLKMVFTSSYIAKIACMVMMYGMMSNFLEIYYMNILKLQWLKQTILGKGIESVVTGVMVIILSLFIGGSAVKRFGWTRTAASTPFLIGLFGLPFLAIQLGFKQQFIEMMESLPKDKKKPLPDSVNHAFAYLVLVIYVFGFFTSVITKSFKYSFFDPTKEMAYIPLDDDVRAKAKAAVDVLASRIGKSGSSMLFIILNGAFKTSNSLNYILTISILFICGVLLWLWATISLGKDMKKAEMIDDNVELAHKNEQLK